MFFSGLENPSNGPDHRFHPLMVIPGSNCQLYTSIYPGLFTVIGADDFPDVPQIRRVFGCLFPL